MRTVVDPLERAVLKAEIDIKVVEDHLKQYEEKLIQDSLDDQQWQKVQHEIARLKAEVDLYRSSDFGKTH